MSRTPEDLWKPIAGEQLKLGGVTGGTGFGRSEGLRIENRIYAMLVNGELAVEAPEGSGR